MISEVEIISDKSRYFISQNKTYTLGLLKYIMTRNDDSHLEEFDNSGVVKIKKESRKLAIREIINKNSIRLNYLNGVISRPDFMISEEMEDLALGRLDIARNSASQYIEKRQSADVSISSLLGDISNERLNISRLEVLRRNYLRDIRRLDATLESSQYIGNLQDEACPVCGTEITNFSLNLNEYQERNLAEQDKIKRNLSEVNSLLNKIKIRESSLLLELEKYNQIIRGLDEEKSKLDLSISDSSKILERIIENRNLIHEIEFLAKQISDLTDNILKIDSEEIERSDYTYSYPIKYIEFLETRISRILLIWGFSKREIDFSFESIDFSANGVKRLANGKGVRAIFLFAQTIGLLEMANIADNNLSNFIIIDSPFTSYRREKREEGISESNMQQFERVVLTDIIRNHSKLQYIIMENKEGFGEEDIEGVNVIRLGEGGGFIPIVPS